MKIFTKDFDKINERDLLEIESLPKKFESRRIEYKIKYIKDTNELRKDIIQFANGELEGLLFFGISDNPIKIVGIIEEDVEVLTLAMNELLKAKIDPLLSPFPLYNIIPLSNQKYIFAIKIFPKSHGIYGIRLSDNSSNINYKRYEFYNRMDGSKHQLNIEEVVNLVESKSTGQEKILHISIQPYARVELQDKLLPDRYIDLRAVNKSVRSITVLSWGLFFVQEEIHIFRPEKSSSYPYMESPKSLPVKLQDGDACHGMFTAIYLEDQMRKHGITYPIEIQAFFDTNDGRFYSKIKSLND